MNDSMEKLVLSNFPKFQTNVNKKRIFFFFFFCQCCQDCDIQVLSPIEAFYLTKYGLHGNIQLLSSGALCPTTLISDTTLFYFLHLFRYLIYLISVCTNGPVHCIVFLMLPAQCWIFTKSVVG